jgi:ubiquinone/menaquinone biosynthesis C-methylase UbiE
MDESAEDLKAHREWLLSFVRPADDMAIVDLGCGTGEDLLAMAKRIPNRTARFIGVDASEQKLSAASERAGHEDRISFLQHRVGERLPFDDATFNVVYSSNLLECLDHPESFVAEAARVLRPGGMAVIAHWDWDSQLFDATDKARLRRLVQAFSDWQQPWMDHSDGWMGRRLNGIFGATRLFDGATHTRVLTNTIFAAPWYGHGRAQDFSALVKQELVSAEDYAGFLKDQAALHAQGRYFYSITGFAYVGVRVT